MALVARRESMIALRARHKAHRVASDILYDQPIDIDHFECANCREKLDWRNSSRHYTVKCHICRFVNPVPDYLKPRVAEQLPPPEYEYDRSSCLRYFIPPQILYVHSPSVLDRMPLWLLVATLALLILEMGCVILMVF